MSVGTAVYPDRVAEDAVVQAAQHVPARCDAALSQAFEILGKRWNGVIVGTLMESPAGFSEIRRALGGISDSVLADRLAELATAGMVVREVDAGPPVSVRYHLSASGAALVPVLRDLMDWSREHLGG